MTMFDMPGDAMLVIREILLRTAAVDIGHYRKEFVGICIQRRLKKHAVGSIREYAGLLERDPGEPQRFRAELSVYHSRFTRDPVKFQALRETIIPELLRKKRERRTMSAGNPALRVWSAGCAGGEEPYSIAILIEEMLEQEKDNWGVMVYATDINPALIDKARQGVYREDELAKAAIGQKYVRRLGDGSVTIAERIKQRVNYSVSDLLEDPPGRGIDILLCRNVLIYFAPSAVRRLLLDFHASLNDGGYLVLGNTEVIDDYFMCHYAKIKCKGEFFYRKIAKGSPEYDCAVEKQKKISSMFGISSC